MCGLFGIATSETLTGRVKRGNFIMDFLDAGVVRGKDGTGMFAVTNPNELADYIKLAVPGSIFKDTRMFSNFIKPIDNYKFLIGHHRGASMGRINNQSAHPYQWGNITLVHNGTLNVHSRAIDNIEMNTDSEEIAYNINKHGAEKTLSKLIGSFALIWHDARTGKLYAARNNLRPLYFCTIKNEKTVLFGSEKEMLEWLVIRNNMESDTFYYVKPDTILEFPVEDPTKWSTKKVKFYVPPKITAKDWPKSNYKASAGELESDISSLGYKRGGTVIFYPVEFIPSINNNKRGNIIGYSENNEGKYTEVRVSNVSSNLMSTEAGGLLQGKVVGYYYDSMYIPVLRANKVKKLKGTVTNIKDAKNNNDPVEDDMCTGPLGSKISVKEFLTLVQDGCAIDGMPININDADSIHWIDYRTPLCPKCSQEWYGYN